MRYALCRYDGPRAEVQDDHSIAGAALRETYEELGIPPDNVEILGMLGPEYSLGNRARVWPVVVCLLPSHHRTR
jgi:8-oxo-dGTP pyrophosphatase MutT (NUDIX family)